MILPFPSWNDFSVFLEDERHVQPQSTLKSIYRFISEYFRCKDFNRDSFREMLHYLRTSKKIKTNRLNKYITMAKHIDSYFRLKIIDDYKAYPVTDPERVKIIMTDEQMCSICNCHVDYPPFINEDPIKHKRRAQQNNLRYRAVFMTLRFSGMRPDELVNIQWSDYMGTHFRIYAHKTRKTRNVPIPKELRECIDVLPKYPHGLVFSGQKGQLKKQTINEELRKRLKILRMDERITAYCFRYSFDTLCAIHGGESTLPQIAKIAGHSLQTAYNYYLQYSVHDLQDALHASHPGLREVEDIDTIKRVVMESVKKLVDMSKYTVSIHIAPKEDETRSIRLS